MHKFRQFYIRDNMMQGIKDYIENRWEPGSFLSAVIVNNLKQAVMYADDDNMENLPAFVDYFYNHAPIDCWGSEENFLGWLEGEESK